MRIHVCFDVVVVTLYYQMKHTGWCISCACNRLVECVGESDWSFWAQYDCLCWFFWLVFTINIQLWHCMRSSRNSTLYEMLLVHLKATSPLYVIWKIIRLFYERPNAKLFKQNQNETNRNHPLFACFALASLHHHLRFKSAQHTKMQIQQPY